MRRFWIVWFAFCSSVSFANQDEDFSKDDAVPGSYLSLGLVGNSFAYKEHLDLPKKSTESGWLPGVELRAAFLNDDNSAFLEGILRLSYNQLHYDGSTQGGTPIQGNGMHGFYSGEFLGGFNLGSLEGLRCSLYLGFELRYWLRGHDVSKSGDYDELYSTGALISGLRLNHAIASDWGVNFDFSARQVRGGTVVAYLSQVDSSLDNLNLPLGSAFGFRSEVGFWYASEPTHRWNLGVWYQNFEIGKGTKKAITSGGIPVTDNGATLGAYEPASDTQQTGVTISSTWFF